VNANSSDNRPNMADLVRDLTDLGTFETEDAVARPPTSPSGAALMLTDLVSDDNGEIVFFNDGGFQSLSIETDSAVLSSGQAKDHVTKAGDDVTGMNYVMFDNGMTLYFDDGLSLILPEG